MLVVFTCIGIFAGAVAGPTVAYELQKIERKRKNKKREAEGLATFRY